MDFKGEHFTKSCIHHWANKWCPHVCISFLVLCWLLWPKQLYWRMTLQFAGYSLCPAYTRSGTVHCFRTFFTHPEEGRPSTHPNFFYCLSGVGSWATSLSREVQSPLSSAISSSIFRGTPRHSQTTKKYNLSRMFWVCLVPLHGRTYAEHNAQEAL